jgi:hypothetical protein
LAAANGQVVEEVRALSAEARMPDREPGSKGEAEEVVK